MFNNTHLGGGGEIALTVMTPQSLQTRICTILINIDLNIDLSNNFYRISSRYEMSTGNVNINIRTEENRPPQPQGHVGHLVTVRANMFTCMVVWRTRSYFPS